MAPSATRARPTAGQRVHLVGVGDARLSVRACRHEDIAEVLTVWAAGRDHPASVADDAAAVEQLLAHAGAYLLIAVRDERIVVGTLVVTWDGWRGNMYRLVVAAGQRRSGIARRLVRRGEEHLHAQGARRVSAVVVRDDAAAAVLWAALVYQHE